MHLAPSPVVAGVWPTVRRDPIVVEHELEITAYLASRGAPVAAPHEPVPHCVRDRTVSLWHHVPNDPNGPLDAVSAGRGLHLIHDLLADPGAPDLSGFRTSSA